MEAKATRAVEVQTAAEKATAHIISAYTRAVPSHDSLVYKVVGQQRAASAVLELLMDLGWSPPQASPRSTTSQPSNRSLS